METNAEQWIKGLSQDIVQARLAVEKAIEEARNGELPSLQANLFYFEQRYVLECIKLSAVGDKRRQLIEEQLQQALDLLLRHREFAQTFWRGDGGVVRPFNPEDSLLAGRLLATVAYAQILRSELDGDTTHEAGSPTGLSYAGDIIDLIELGKGLHLTGAVRLNGKPAPVASIFSGLGKMFNMESEGWTNRIPELKNRKEPLKLIGEMMKKLMAYVDTLPRDQPSRKRF
jgi:hypothetical protein